MRWIATLALFLVLAGTAPAAGSDEQYLDIYNEILQADTLQQGGQGQAAALRYLQAQTDLQKLRADHPAWNPDIVKFRLDYLDEKLQALVKFLPSTNAPAGVTPAPVQPSAANQPPVSEQPTLAALQQQNAGYQEQIRSLTSVNTELEGKLEEALKVQPAAVSPEQLARANAKVAALQKERDLLAVALDQEKANSAAAVAEAVKNAATASESKLAEATKELELLKAARASEADENTALKARAAADQKQAQDQVARLKEASAESDKILAAATKELELLKEARPAEAQVAVNPKQIPEERDQLKQAMAEISTDETEIAHLKEAVADAEKKQAAANGELESLKSGHPAEAPAADANKAIVQERDKLKEELVARSKDLADAEAHHNEELLNVRAALQQAEQRRDELEKKLAAAPPAPPSGEPASAKPDNSAMAAKLEQLRARVAVLEADHVPYTAEELSILKLSPPRAPAESPKPLLEVKHLHSVKDLPPGAGALWKEALQATMEHNYTMAEQKFNEVLRQDETNVYVLAYLANAQFAAGHLEDCEKSVGRALAVEPNDPGSLYLLGVLRYRQNKLEDALDALSRSAEYNPTNSATQNFLGCVLADKGLRPAAETALRKALQIDPDYAEAHFNLAVVYVGNQPPSLELARWHYKRALALGHGKSEMLEKMLAEGQ